MNLNKTMRRVLLTFLSCVTLPVLFLVQGAAAEEKADSLEQDLQKMLETVEKNTRKLPAGLGQKRLDKKDAEAAHMVFETSQKILANENISDEFRIWTLKRQANALIPLAYEEIPQFFPRLAEVVDELDGKENCEKIAQEAERHLLIIGTQLAVQGSVESISIDVETLAERMILFAKQYPGQEADALIDHFFYSVYQIKPVIQRDKQLALVAPLLLKYFVEVPSPLHKSAAEKLSRIMRRLELPGKPMLITGYTLDGKAFDPRLLKDKVVLVQFWGTWCIPCREEFSLLVRLYEQYKSQGLEIVSINTAVSGDENPVKVKQFIDTTKFDGQTVTWTVLHESFPASHKQESVTKFYGIDELPILVLVGRNGNVIKVNPLSSMLEQEIQDALNEFLLDDLTSEERKQREEAQRKQDEKIDKEIQAELDALQKTTEKN